MKPSLRIVIVAPDSLAAEDPTEDNAEAQAERSRSLRIGLLENGYNIVAVLPADVFLPERLAQISPDMVIVDAESGARDTLEHVALMLVAFLMLVFGTVLPVFLGGLALLGIGIRRLAIRLP